MAYNTDLGIINLINTLPKKNWEIGHRQKKPTTITVHYNGPATSVKTDSQMPAFLRMIANHHMKDGWAGVPGGADGIMYHYSVGPQGGLYQMREDINQLWHAGVREANENGLAVFLPVGKNQPIPEAMKTSLFAILYHLMYKYRLSQKAIRIHSDWKDTECPGGELKNIINTWRTKTEILKPTDSIFTNVTVNIDNVCTSILASPTGEYNEYDICEIIVPAYFRIAEECGMNPLFPIAQMIHETWYLQSFWASRPRRNPAGLGVTGTKVVVEPTNTTNWSYNPASRRWEAGISFNAWDKESIPAHLGRLLAYFLKDGEANEVQQKYIDYALSVRQLPNAKRGIKKLTDLNGNWAVPGTVYAQAILKIANTIY